MSGYRKRFVQYNMLLIGIVLTIVMGTVAVYSARESYMRVRMTMEQIVTPLQNYSQPPKDKSKDKPKGKPNGRKKGEDKDILTVFYAEDGSYSLLSANNSFSEEELQDLLTDIAAQDAGFGIMRHVVYYRSGGSPDKIALASTDILVLPIVRLCLVLLAVWLVAMLLFYLISRKLSHLAAKPMEDAMAREKQFVADASHDLKTPLSVILANTSILMENPEASVGSVHRWLDSTQSAAKRMQQLISQMLTLAEIERPDAEMAIEGVDLSSLCMKAALELESLAYEKNVALDTELPDFCQILGNADALQRIVSSLLENALKYEPAGGRVLLTLEEEKKKVTLRVQNFGSRVASEDLPHIFDRFYRSDKSRTNESGSFGLGLAITKELTEKSGGTICVTSSSSGTMFQVTLPR